MNGYTLYMISVISEIGQIAGFLGVLILIVFLCAGGIGGYIYFLEFSTQMREEFKKEYKELLVWCKKVFIIGLIATGISVLCPTYKQLLIIYVTPRIINGENLDNISSKALKALDSYLDEIIKERENE